jgi:DNA-binding transcriptional LysR family regulator
VLVERSTRHLRLTDAGLLLRPHAARILADVEEAAAALGRFAGAPRGTLRVNAPFTFAVGLLAPMLPGFLARYPEVRVVLDIENRIVAMPAEAADVVIRVGTLPDSDLVARRLARMALWTCAGPGYLAARGAPARPADLAGHVLIASFDRPMTWSYAFADGRAESVEVRPGSVVPEPSALRAVLAGGAGIGRLPDFLAAEAVAAGEVVRLFPDAACDAVDVHALYPSHRSLSAKVRVFIDALAEHLARRGSGPVRTAPGPPPAAVG